jgi:hypothetical protein
VRDLGGQMNVEDDEREGGRVSVTDLGRDCSDEGDAGEPSSDE